MRKQYVIVGDNNFWYAVTGLVDHLELKEEVNEIWRQIANGDFRDNSATELYAYPTKLEHVMRYGWELSCPCQFYQ